MHYAEFIEKVELHFEDAAREAGVYVASAMGFDSVPGDLGVQVGGAACVRCGISCLQVRALARWF